MVNTLVTGVGGPLGQALVKAVRMSSIPCKITGTDRAQLSVGLHWVDRGYVLPDCGNEKDYIDEMCRVCEQEKIAAVLPGSDSELYLLSRESARLMEVGAKVIASSPDALRIGLDKLETCRFLETAGLNYPRYISSLDAGEAEAFVEAMGFPIFAKPRKGSGSRHIMKLRSWDDIRFMNSLGGEFVLQEYLCPDDEEYTVASFTDKTGRQVGCIAFKRELVAGNTYRAWVVHNAEIEAEARAVIRAFGASGPCNVQLRLTARGAVSFEINPRFSGTTAMRAHFGYNEVEMALRSFVLSEELTEPVVRDGTALRFWDEYYIDAE